MNNSNKPQHRPVAASPVLFHPQPKSHHPIPMMRSPPPLQNTGSTPSSAYASSPYQPQQQAGGPQSAHFHPAYASNFFADPTTQMGFQVGQSAVMAGSQYVEQNFNRYINVTALKHYFNVSNSYVLTKVRVVLFPWRHRPWSRMQRSHAAGQGDNNLFLAPRDDINSPDMYIPVMAFVTYILLSTIFAGLDGKFQTDLLGRIATTALVIVILEILGLKLGCYLLNISNESQLLDLVAYSGYKFVGSISTMIVTKLLSGMGSWVTWLSFAYFFNANAFFLLRSLKYVLLPENAERNVHAIGRSQKSKRTIFLFGYSYVVQFVFMWILSMEDFNSETDSEYSSYWRDWFISSRGHEYFCEIDEEYLTDRFNLTGLNTEVQYYQYALDLVTDVFDLDCDDDMREQIEKSARHLYGLVHARYIITTRGLAKMLDKYKKSDFGRCPRVLCANQPLLPIGLSDLPALKSVKLYCARCEDVYVPKSSRHAAIDGAYFGASFPHILFQVYPVLIPMKSPERFVPKCFGFKVHAAAALMRWQEQQRIAQRRRLIEAEIEAAGPEDIRRVVESDDEEDEEDTGEAVQGTMPPRSDSKDDW